MYFSCNFCKQPNGTITCSPSLRSRCSWMVGSDINRRACPSISRCNKNKGKRLQNMKPKQFCTGFILQFLKTAKWNYHMQASDFIWDFGKLPFPVHLRKYFINIGKISAKVHEIGKIKAIFLIGNDSHIRR